jgi:hypothetical protein
MATSKKAAVISPKKQLRKKIAETLEATFTDLKKQVGEKKFEKHVKQASKVLAAGAATKTKSAKLKVVVPAKKATTPAKKKTGKK